MHKNVQRLAAAMVVCGLTACADTAGTKAGPVQAAQAAVSTPAGPAPIRAQDDIYRYVNGAWLASNEIPADRARWGAFDQLRDDAVTQARTVVEDAESAGARGTADQRKIATLYASFMDEARLAALGAKPIAPQMRAIDAIKSKRELPAVIAQFNELDITTPIRLYIGQDARDPTHYIPTIYQGGLGLPDRDYYLKDDDAKLMETRAKYVRHVSKMLALAGVPDSDAAAAQVLAVETALAKAQWTRVENRDPVKTYNKQPIARLDALTPGYSWKTWVTGVRIAGKTDAVIVAQPSYLDGFARAVDSLPLDAWKAYFKYRVVASCAPYLSKPFTEESFAFEGGVLAGTPVDLPRWKRGVGVVEASIGEGLGKLYVAKFFPPENKVRMDGLVKNILAAYKQSIDGLDWMGPATKKEAQAKLAKFDPKVAYPTRWRDYTALSFKSDDLLGNVMRARRFESNRDIAKLGRPIDRTEWGMTPQTVNAYYNRGRNEIVFPAAILQPPFFDVKADDATNYGAIGAVIGHEISHGFDDSGSQSDGDGRLRDWWTAEDRARFTEKTKALIAEYDAFEPVPGYHVNGALTLGENIADNSGVAIAYKAYHLSLNGKDAPVIDGKTGDQRFYAGFATIYRNKTREPALIRQIKSDPHSPGEYRANGTLRNQTPFYEAYGVKPGDGMYVPPEQRVQIW
ncbi:MAG: M13 family metallopeptidase [Burkholderiaceae bacterium]